MRDLRVLCLHGYRGSADFGWWHTPSRGWDRTRDWAIDLFATQPGFDGVLGFSQGAALAGLLAGLRENQLREIQVHENQVRENQVRQNAGRIGFDFAVMFGGFKNDAPQHAELYRHTFALPSVHVIGGADRIIPPPESLELANQFQSPVVLEHSGGHIIPRDRAVLDGVAQFLDRMCQRPLP
jgi:predicted esterase